MLEVSRAPLILALDISKNSTGVAKGRVGEKPVTYSIKSDSDYDEYSAGARLTKQILAEIKVDRPDWIYCEAPLIAGNLQMRDPKTAQTLIGMAFVAGVVSNIAGIQFRPVSVNTVRVAFLGRGNFPKKDRNGDPLFIKDEGKRRAMALSKMLGWEPKNHDEADALAVWFYGCTRVAPNRAVVITPMMQAKSAGMLK